MKIATSAVSVSLSPPQKHTHKQIIKKVRETEKGGEIKVMLQSQKHSALPRRVFVCTTIFQKIEKKKKDESKLYKHRKEKKANIYKLFLVKAGETPIH